MTTDRPDRPASPTPPRGPRRDSVRVLAPQLVAMSDDEHAAAVDALAALCLWALRGGGPAHLTPRPARVLMDPSAPTHGAAP